MYHLYFDVWTCALYTIVGIVGAILINKFMCLSSSLNPILIRRRKRQASLATGLFFFIYLCLAVFRKVTPEIGGLDTANYINNFLTIHSGGIDRHENAALEWGFQTLTGAFRSITDEYKLYFTFMYSLIVCGYIYFIKKMCPRGLVYIPFISLMYPYFRSFNTMRTSVAISILLIGLCYLDKNKWKSLIIMLSSVLIHRISFLYVLVWPFYYLHKKYFPIIRRRDFIFIAIIGVTVVYFVSLQLQQYVLLYQVVEGGDASYLRSTLDLNIFQKYPMYTGQLLLFGFVVFKYKTIKWEGNVDVLRILFLYDLWMTPAALILGMFRFVEYFYLVRLSLWSIIIYILIKRKPQTNALFIKGIFCVVFVTWLVIRIYKEWEATGTSPYIFEIFSDDRIIKSL